MVPGFELPKRPQDDVVWAHLTTDERALYEASFQEVVQAQEAMVEFQPALDTRARLKEIAGRLDEVAKSGLGVAAALVDALAEECASSAPQSLHSLLGSPDRVTGLVADLSLVVGVGPWAGRRVEEIRMGVVSPGGAGDSLRVPTFVSELQAVWSHAGPLGFTGKKWGTQPAREPENVAATPYAKVGGVISSRTPYYRGLHALRTVSLNAPVLRLAGDDMWYPFAPAGVWVEGAGGAPATGAADPQEYGTLVGASAETTMLWDEAMRTGRKLASEVQDLEAERMVESVKERGWRSGPFAGAERRLNMAVSQFKKTRHLGEGRLAAAAADGHADMTLLHGVTLLDLLRSSPGDGLRFSDLVMRSGSGRVKMIQCFALLSEEEPGEEQNSSWTSVHAKPTPLPDAGPLVPVILETLDEAREMLALGRFIGESVIHTDIAERTSGARWNTDAAAAIRLRRSGVVAVLEYDRAPDRVKVISPSKIRVVAMRNVQAQNLAQAKPVRTIR